MNQPQHPNRSLGSIIREIEVALNTLEKTPAESAPEPAAGPSAELNPTNPANDEFALRRKKLLEELKAYIDALS
jgi:phosphatidate phosphatase APP1